MIGIFIGVYTDGNKDNVTSKVTEDVTAYPSAYTDSTVRRICEKAANISAEMKGSLTNDSRTDETYLALTMDRLATLIDESVVWIFTAQWYEVVAGFAIANIPLVVWLLWPRIVIYFKSDKASNT